jgi:hypothetical protein
LRRKISLCGHVRKNGGAAVIEENLIKQSDKKCRKLHRPKKCFLHDFSEVKTHRVLWVPCPCQLPRSKITGIFMGKADF